MATTEKTLRIEPIGGVAQIGSNMTLIKGEKSSIYIDCGILFPYDDAFNLNYLIPDLYHLDPVQALVITHGHEDHIGAIPHFVQQFPDTPIYAPRFAHSLIQDKLHQAGLAATLHLYRPQQNIEFEDFRVIPHQVNHSIPDTFGLHINSKKYDTSLFYCSDFKYNPQTPYEPTFDIEALGKEAKDFSKRVLLPDSTNILSSNDKTVSEAELIPDLKKNIAHQKGRVFITTFSSNIHRLQTIFDIAKDLGKKVVLYGGSMHKYAAQAEKHKLLETHGLMRDVEGIAPQGISEKNLIIIVSGCQGDFKSALRRVIVGEDSHFHLGPNDRFIFSSKTIPGNAKRIGLLMNQVVESGCDLVVQGEELIHASGHAGRSDLKELYEGYNPTHILPIHGESLFLKAHRDYIHRVFPSAQTEELYNFDSLIISKDSVTTEEGEAHEPLLIHGKALEISRDKVRERRKIAHNGLLLLSVNLSKNRGDYQFEFKSQGIPDFVCPNNEDLGSIIDSALQSKKKITDIKEDVRIKLRKYCSEQLGYKPITHVFVHGE